MQFRICVNSFSFIDIISELKHTIFRLPDNINEGYGGDGVYGERDGDVVLPTARYA